MKGYDFSIRPFNVLDQLEVIWPHHDRKCDLHDHNNDFCVSHVMRHIKWKVMTSVFDLSMFKTNWRSFDLTMTENVTSDDLYDHNNDFCVSHVIKINLATLIFNFHTVCSLRFCRAPLTPTTRGRARTGREARQRKQKLLPAKKAHTSDKCAKNLSLLNHSWAWILYYEKNTYRG